MIGIRPYKPADAATILSWCRDEKAFYKWSAGVLGDYPITEEKFKFVEALMPFTAFDEDKIVGFFTLRNPGESREELRFGFVIVDDSRRGAGIGRRMLQMAIRYAADFLKAKRITIGVLENNPGALRCYLGAGFREVPQAEPVYYDLLGQRIRCVELEMDV